MNKVFSKGNDVASYMDYDRGSSEDWDDQSEFVTPVPNRQISIPAARQDYISKSE